MTFTRQNWGKAPSSGKRRQNTSPSGPGHLDGRGMGKHEEHGGRPGREAEPNGDLGCYDKEIWGKKKGSIKIN